jgi:hypothetical protein
MELRSCFLHGDYTGKDECPGCVPASSEARAPQTDETHERSCPKHPDWSESDLVDWDLSCACKPREPHAALIAEIDALDAQIGQLIRSTCDAFRPDEHKGRDVCAECGIGIVIHILKRCREALKGAQA